LSADRVHDSQATRAPPPSQPSDRRRPDLPEAPDLREAWQRLAPDQKRLDQAPVRQTAAVPPRRPTPPADSRAPGQKRLRRDVYYLPQSCSAWLGTHRPACTQESPPARRRGRWERESRWLAGG